MLETRNIAVNTRHDFGTSQIMDPSVLIRGLVVITRGDGRARQKWVILAPPTGKWVLLQKYSSKEISRISLADNGVIPYDSGKWHNNHWLENTEQMLTEKELENYYQPL